MQRLYLVPVETVVNNAGMTCNGAKYFNWGYDPDPETAISTPTACIYYGYHPWVLVLAKDISQADHDTLIGYPDVFAFPALDQLNQTIDPGDNIDGFFEGIDLPTDWMTPSTTYIELLRRTISIFLFCQRYHGISQGHDLFENVDLEDKYSTLTVEEQGWFDATIESYGYDPALILPQMKFRQMLKMASDWMGARTFYIGGIEF
jgi:hypothetical protein